jgi:P-type Cu2+ transporter
MTMGAAARAAPFGGPSIEAGGVDVSAYVQSEGDLNRLHLMVEGVHCGGCVGKIERALQADPAVTGARVNLTTRRLALAWRGPAALGSRLVATVEALGFRAVPYDPQALASGDAADERQLLRAMAVAGFAAGNIMLLSVSVWAGHAQGMGEATRALLHWFSALIALPTIAYAGRPFFSSACAALRRGRTNMDVPISVGIALAAAMSLFETVRGGEHAYFDSAVMLLFFLLVGRYLDRRARGRARSAAERLLALHSSAVRVLDAQGPATFGAGTGGGSGHGGPRQRRRADRGRRARSVRHLGGRHEPDYRRDAAVRGARGRIRFRRYSERRSTHPHRGHGDG